MQRFSALFALALILFFSTTGSLLWAKPDWQLINIDVADQELQIKRFAANGRHLILWLTPGFGEPNREVQLASALAKRGVEVWHLDLAESLFLPQSTSTLRAMDGRYVAALIATAHQRTGKQIVLLTRAYGSLPVLRGARLWQETFFQTKTTEQTVYFSGAILFSPELYSHTVELGLEPVYDPIASATNIPLMLYQSGKRGNRWQLDKNMAQLETGGAQVMLKLLPGVTGVFYHDDNAQETLDTLTALPDELVHIIWLLDKIPMPETVAPLAKNPETTEGGRDIKLLPFRGEAKPAILDLENSQGKHFLRDEYRGKVTLVNFWASWCRPCVEEIPSLNTLREKMQGRPFELISVNYAEDKLRISEFLQKVKVDFPVLLDKDGQVAAQWNVLAFPATFIIAADGKITYGVNGALYWDSPEVIEKIENLIQQGH